MKRVVLSLVLAVLVTVTFFIAHAGGVTATSRPQVGGSLLALGIAAPFHVVSSGMDMNESQPTDVQNYSVTFPVGASTGWHYHAGLVVVTITAGAVTTYNKTSTGCVSVTYTKGHVFVEPPYHIHNAVNAGSKPAAAVTSEFITHGKAETVNVARPANCPNV